MTIDNLRYLKYHIYDFRILKVGFSMNGSIATREWFCCPVCGQKLAKVSPLAKGGVFIKCKRCKNEVEVKRTA